MEGSQEHRGRRFTRPLDSIASVVVPSVASAVDPDELLDRVDIDGLIERIDVDAVVGRVDIDALVDRVDIDALVDRVDIDSLINRVDVDALIARIDVNGLIDRIDVDALIDRVDVDALIDRVDVDALIDRVDVERLIGRVDLDRLIGRVDLDAVVDAVDVDRVASRIDVNAVADRVDVDRVADRVDVNAVADRVDVDRVVARVDVNAVADTVDIDRIVERSTKGVSDRLIDLVRRQIVGLDEVMMRTATRLLGRQPSELPTGPPAIAPSQGSMSGRYAGPVSRLLAFLGDLVLISTSFTLLAAGLQFLVGDVLNIDVDLVSDSSLVGLVLLVAFGFGYFWISTALTGRTVGQTVIGVKVVAADGQPLSAGRVFVRFLVLPLSFVVFAIGALMVLVDRRRRALHDVAAGSAVVYDWGDRPAALPGPLTRFLERRDAV